MNEKETTTLEMCERCEKLYSLKHEIGVLRRQIDTLNVSALAIRKQNYVLEGKLKKLEANYEELKLIQQDKNDLFATIVHDIKNPTTIIKSLVEILRSYDNSNDEIKSIIDDIVISTKQVISLSQEISNVLTLEGSTVKMFLEWADPGLLATEVVRRNAVNAKHKEQTISIQIEDKLPQFNVDVTKIMEVFDNMISNSIKYTQVGGKIGVSVSQEDDNIQFEFSDNGLGMNDEDLKYVFKRGAKLSAKPTGGETSSGIGLWIVKKIIDAHKGRIWIRSSVGVGTVFTIHIPIQSMVEEEQYERW